MEKTRTFPDPVHPRPIYLQNYGYNSSTEQPLDYSNKSKGMADLQSPSGISQTAEVSDPWQISNPLRFPLLPDLRYGLVSPFPDSYLVSQQPLLSPHSLYPSMLKELSQARIVSPESPYNPKVDQTYSRSILPPPASQSFLSSKPMKGSLENRDICGVYGQSLWGSDVSTIKPNSVLPIPMSDLDATAETKQRYLIFRQKVLEQSSLRSATETSHKNSLQQPESSAVSSCSDIDVASNSDCSQPSINSSFNPKMSSNIGESQASNFSLPINGTRTQLNSPESAKKRPRTVPDMQKDENYWAKRKKNNEAAKKSRNLRRQKEEELVIRASFFEKECARVRGEVEFLRQLISHLRFQLQYGSATSSSQQN